MKNNMEKQNILFVEKEYIDDYIRRMFASAFKRIVLDEEIVITPLTEEILSHLGDI